MGALTFFFPLIKDASHTTARKERKKFIREEERFRPEGSAELSIFLGALNDPMKRGFHD